MRAAPAPTALMSISHTSPDTTVQQVLDKIDSESLVADALGADGLQGVITAWHTHRRSGGSFSLDLIAHARRGVLQLGDWSVDGNGKCDLGQSQRRGAQQDQPAGEGLSGAEPR